MARRTALAEGGGRGSGETLWKNVRLAPDRTAASRTGRNLPAAIAVGVGLGASVIISLYYVKEIFLAGGRGRGGRRRGGAGPGVRDPRHPGARGAALLGAGRHAWRAPTGAGPRWLLGTFVVFAFVLLIWRMFAAGTDGYVRDATGSVFVLVYPPLLAGFVALLLAA